jgi:hypothetical protein
VRCSVCRSFQATMARELLDHIDDLDVAVVRLDDKVEALMAPFVDARDRLDTIYNELEQLGYTVELAPVA